MTSLAKAQPKKEQGNVLYILHRVAILIAVAAVFYPGFNPGRITTAINRNVSLFTASISYSAIVSNLERALLRGWVENTTFILVMVASIILIVGIIVCCIGGCMSVGNRRMRRYGLYFPLAGGVIMAAGLVCLYVAYSHIVAAANDRVPANFPMGFMLYAIATVVVLVTSVILLVQDKKNPAKLEEKMEMQEKYNLFLLFLPVLALAFVFSYLPLWGWRYAFFDYTAGSELTMDNFVGLKWFTMSNRNYGVLVNEAGPVSFEVCSEAVTKVQFSVPGQRLDFIVIGAPDRKGVLNRYTALTGRPALPPAWTFGLWLTSSFTTSYDEGTVTSFVDGMAERDIPLSVFHFDCFWMRENEWCGFDWDKEMFPDVEGMLKRMHEKGLKICAWINPYLGQKCSVFDEAADKGYLLKKANGDIWQWDLWQAGLAVVDFTNPEAVEWYKGHLRRLMKQGVDCFKTDFGERIPTDVVYHDGSDPVWMHNEVRISIGCVVNEPVQFGALIHIIGDLILHGGTVDGDHGTIIILGFHAAGVHVEFTGDRRKFCVIDKV